MKFNQTVSSASPLITLGSLIFQGSGIWLSGAPNEPASTSYQVTFDSSLAASYSQYPSSGLLWSNTDLSTSSSHHVSVTPYTILDSAIVEMDLDADQMTVVDDSQLFGGTAPAGTTFVAEGQWLSNQCIGTGQFASTCHTSVGTGGSISFTFQGDAVSVWGALASDKAGFSVSIDGGYPTSYSGNQYSNSSSSSVVLASASNLGDGTHIITITNAPADGSSQLEIDYVTLYTSTVSASTRSQTATGSKVGIVVGSILGCALVALLVLAAHLARERRKTSRQQQQQQRQFGSNTTSSYTWSQGAAWMRKSKSGGANSDDARTDDSRSTSSESPRGVAIPLPSLVTKAPPPTHTKTSSFDAPWLESGPNQNQNQNQDLRLSSIHPFSSDADSVPPKRPGFLARWL